MRLFCLSFLVALVGPLFSANASQEFHKCIYEKSSGTVVVFDEEDNFVEEIFDVTNSVKFLDERCSNYEVVENIYAPEDFNGTFKSLPNQVRYWTNIKADWKSVTITEFNELGKVNSSREYGEKIRTHKSEVLTNVGARGTKEYSCIYHLGVGEAKINKIELENRVYSIPTSYMGSFVCWRRSVDDILKKGRLVHRQEIQAVMTSQKDLVMTIVETNPVTKKYDIDSITMLRVNN